MDECKDQIKTAQIAQAAKQLERAPHIYLDMGELEKIMVEKASKTKTPPRSL